jgi:hypothetical protein
MRYMLRPVRTLTHPFSPMLGVCCHPWMKENLGCLVKGHHFSSKSYHYLGYPWFINKYLLNPGFTWCLNRSCLTSPISGKYIGNIMSRFISDKRGGRISLWHQSLKSQDSQMFSSAWSWSSLSKRLRFSWGRKFSGVDHRKSWDQIG